MTVPRPQQMLWQIYDSILPCFSTKILLSPETNQKANSEANLILNLNLKQ